MSNHIDHLFGTSVQQAVASTVQQQKPLFVYLTTDQENTSGEEFLSKFIDETTTQVLDNKFILLKLIQNTTDYGYFTQLFKVDNLPSFYIVNLGKVEGIISQATDKQEFIALVQKYKTQPTTNTNNITTTSNASSQVNTLVQNSTTPVQSNPHSQSNTTIQNNIPTPSTNKPKHDNNNNNNNNTNSKSNNNNNNNRRTTLSEHDISAKKYKEQVDRARHEQMEEKKRLRALINADKRERESRMKEEEEREHPTAEVLQHSVDSIHKETTPSSSSSSAACFLSIKMFDGSTVKHEFKSEDTLSDVRKWLDSEIEIIRPASSMPSFATSANLSPTGYVFHRPVLPRVTYLEQQESSSLRDLELVPRSALILKPTYDEIDPNNTNSSGENAGILKSIFSGVSRVGGALFSFFDYGANAPYHAQHQQQQHHQHHHEEQHGVDYSMHHENDELERLQTIHPDPQPFDFGHPGAAVAPGVLTFDNTSASSLLINIESNPEDDIYSSSISRPHTPSHGSAHDVHIGQRPLIGELGSRSSTPRPQSSRRIQTIHDDNSDSTNSNKDKKHGIDTYNGNSISLNEGDDENKKKD